MKYRNNFGRWYSAWTTVTVFVRTETAIFFLILAFFRITCVDEVMIGYVFFAEFENICFGVGGHLG